MKRIISLAILALLQLACTAQDNPKLESLYAYLKAKGLVKYYTLSNKNQEGLRKRYEFNFGLHDDGPAPIKDFMGRLLDAKEDSAVRAEWRSYREAFHVIRRTLSELTEDAAESYSYEYHLNGHDTIITTIALKPYENSPIPKKFEYPENDSYGTGKTPEMVFFRYTDSDRGLKWRMARIGVGELRVNTIVDTTLYATKDFNVDALHRALQPLFKDKTIKRHEIHCVHDSTFDVYTIDETTPFIEGFLRVEQSVRRQGDNRLTVYKFTSEEKAKLKLHQVMECVRQHIADHPRQAYTICSDEYFPPLNSEEMFRGEPFKEPFSDNGIRKSITIDTLMDEHGFYILINVWEDDEAFPGDWKRQKEMVNGKIVYYSVNDWWP